MTRRRYQRGTMSRVKRAGDDVYVYRWRQIGVDAERIPKSKVIGTVKDLKTETAAWKALELLNINPNTDFSGQAGPPTKFGELTEIYRRKELVLDAYSTQQVYGLNIDNWILPKWRNYALRQLEETPGPVYEQWLASLTETKAGKSMARGTKAKIKNVMSAIFTYGLRWNWIKTHPFHSGRVRQSAKRTRKPESLDEHELQALFQELELRERVLVLLDVPNGLRVGELLALQWNDLSVKEKTLRTCRAVWHQNIGSMKTEESEQILPLDEEMIADLVKWRVETKYAKDGDYIFASPRKNGKQPYWPENLMRNHIRMAAKRAGITKHISWHVFRHTFSTLLIKNGEDVKTVQSMMRHQNARVTLEAYTDAVTDKKRMAQSRIVASILPRDAKALIVPVGAA